MKRFIHIKDGVLNGMDRKMVILLFLLAIVFVGWLTFTVYELIKFHRKKSIGLRNANIGVFSSYSLLIFGVYYLFFAQKLIHSEKSPDNKFRLDVYEESRPRLFAMPGDGSSRIIYLKLFDFNGNKINEESNGCLIWGWKNHKVEWRPKYNMVYYSACGIGLKKEQSE